MQKGVGLLRLLRRLKNLVTNKCLKANTRPRTVVEEQCVESCLDLINAATQKPLHFLAFAFHAKQGLWMKHIKPALNSTHAARLAGVFFVGGPRQQWNNETQVSLSLHHVAFDNPISLNSFERTIMTCTGPLIPHLLRRSCTSSIMRIGHHKITARSLWGSSRRTPLCFCAYPIFQHISVLVCSRHSMPVSYLPVRWAKVWSKNGTLATGCKASQMLQSPVRATRREKDACSGAWTCMNYDHPQLNFAPLYLTRSGSTYGQLHVISSRNMAFHKMLPKISRSLLI